MTDMMCGYGSDRDEVLVAYVYGDIEPAGRAAFDAHLKTCVHCRTELTELRGVRAQLEQWAPPEPLRALTRQSAPQAGPRVRVWTTRGAYRQARRKTSRRTLVLHTAPLPGARISRHSRGSSGRNSGGLECRA